MSDERRDLATLKANLAERDREIRLLRNRLRVIDDCEDKRCHLCLNCLAAAMDEED